MASLVISIHGGAIPVPSRVNPALSPAIDAWFARACTRDPNGRFQSAEELSDALQAAVQQRASAPHVPVSFGGQPRVGPPSSGATVPGSFAVQPVTRPAQSGSNPHVQPGSLRASGSLEGFGATTGGTGAGASRHQGNQKLLVVMAGVVTFVIIGCLGVVGWQWNNRQAVARAAAVASSSARPPEPSPGATDPPGSATPAPPEPVAEPVAAATSATPPPTALRPQTPAPTPLPPPSLAPSARGGTNVLPVPQLPPPAASATASAKPKPSATPTKKNNDFDRQ
jgi:serine/threonine-protein kinase